MDLLLSITMVCICFVFMKFAAAFGEMFKGMDRKKEENECGMLFFAAFVSLVIWSFNTLGVQPYRIGFPEGSLIHVYHKDYPPDMSEEEKQDKMIEEASDSRRWNMVNDRVDYVNNRIDRLEENHEKLLGHQNTDRNRTIQLEIKVEKLEREFNKHLQIGPAPIPPSLMEIQR